MMSSAKSFYGIIGNTPAMREVFEMIKLAAKTDVPVLITGDSGTGKELVAKAIHDYSSRRKGPYLPFNTGAISPNLVSSTLFGHRKGSFTGAVQNQKGLFELAHGGTIFLDEIASMDQEMQIALLRVLETKTILPIGAARSKRVDTRIIAASNKNLRKMVSIGKFRKDLLFRLEVFSIHLPKLSERREDIPLLVNYFLKKYNKEYSKKVNGVTNDALRCLKNYHWPGNVRELENTIQRAVLLTENEKKIRIKDLPSQIIASKSHFEKLIITPGMTLDEVQKKVIVMTLSSCGGNKATAAKILGITRKSLYNKINRFNLEKIFGRKNYV
jgi:transcriptional regulator with PAS, ATPase and Fis domain